MPSLRASEAPRHAYLTRSLAYRTLDFAFLYLSASNPSPLNFRFNNNKVNSTAIHHI